MASSHKVAKSAWPDWQQGSPRTHDTLHYEDFLNDPLGFPWYDPAERGHSTTTFVPTQGTAKKAATKPVSVDLTHRTGKPDWSDLSAREQSLMLKHRASALIQKYSGTRWREAQRTKWLLDIVLHIDRDYRQYITDQATQIAALNDQMIQTTGLQMAAAEAVQAQNEQLRRRVDDLEHQLRQAQGALLDMQNRVNASEIALGEAEEASRAAAEECHQLQQAVALLAESDAAARKLLSNRTHVIREALLATRGRVRQAAESSKRNRLEVAELLAQERQKAETERAALTAQVENSLAAAGTLVGAAGRLEADRLRLELAAYKEPWQYATRDKSPAQRRQLAWTLGTRQKTLTVPVPF